MSKSIHIFGFHSIEGLLNTNPESILRVFIQTGRDDIRVRNIVTALTDQKISFLHINKNKLENIAKGELHQGIIAEAILPPFAR